MKSIEQKHDLLMIKNTSPSHKLIQQDTHAQSNIPEHATPSTTTLPSTQLQAQHLKTTYTLPSALTPQVNEPVHTVN